jgi:hypothetical protein
MKVKMTFAVLAMTALALVVPASSTANRNSGDGISTSVVASGLFDPRGIDAEEAHRGDRILVVQTGTGEITEILTRKGADPTIQPFATLPGAADVAARGFDAAFATGGLPPEAGGDAPAGLYKVPRGGDGSLIADIAAYQQDDPDPFDLEEIPTETNPFGIALLRHGILVADSAGNDLLKVRKDGSIETVARFPTRNVEFPELPPGAPPDFPPAGTPMDSESVPTAVAIGPDGAWYVSELRGFPFTPGTSRIWRIEPGTEDVTCDPDTKRGPCTLFADGFTSVIDIAWAGDTLLVLEIAKEGLLPAELGLVPPIGALWAYRHGDKSEIAPGALQAPGGVAVADDERIYVSTGTVFGEGAGEVVRIKGALDEDHGHGHHGDDHDDDDDDHGDKKHKKHKKHKGDHHKKHKKHKKSKKHDD